MASDGHGGGLPRFITAWRKGVGKEARLPQERKGANEARKVVIVPSSLEPPKRHLLA